MGRRFSSRRTRSSKPNLTWTRLVMAAPNSITATSKEAVLSLSNAVGGLELTVVRQRGIFGLQPLNEDLTAEGSAQGAWGIGIFTAESWAIGVTAIPGPYSDPSFDGWLMWQPWFLGIGRYTPSGGEDEFYASPQNHVIDGKAMRKLDPGYTLGLVIESSASSVIDPMYYFSIALLTRLRGTS